MNNKSTYSAWAITLLAAGISLYLLRRGKQSYPPSLINYGNMAKKSYYPEYDYSQVRPLSRGYRNNNPVNIRIGSSRWQGKVYPNTDGAFEQFNDMVYGYRAALVLLRNYIASYGLDTIEKMITRFAPTNENNTESYINNVSRMTGIPRNQVISRNDKDALTSIVYAMSISENGYKVKGDNGQYIDMQAAYGLPNMDIINEAWRIM